ncbi:peptidoglycan-binding domain-containing protein [Microbacterium sp. BWT-B31]|uniref:peptidoglycan-binding protein n=1 Tax=Microbacterium sp. BWT-B31 TaxID=3232072 RepID=UPI003529381B
MLGAVVLAGAAGAVGWAAASVLSPAEDVLEATPFTFVEVAAGEVGSSIQLNTVAEWSPVPVGTNRAAGVVTTIGVAPGEEVVQGSVLYTVDLRPVVVSQGAVPAFRAIGAGAEGADVVQLQALLAARGVYDGPADGTAGSGTVGAIREWQKSMGMPQTGVIEPGDVIFVPTLPTRIALDEEVVFRGATLTGGEEVVRGLPAAPVFTVPVTGAQAAMMPAGTRVEITAPDGTVWTAFAGARASDPNSGTIDVALDGESGTVICADQCGQVPVTGEALLGSRIVTVAPVQGLVVPSAALVTEASGQTAVITADGQRVPVTVVASARGMSVVEGVEAGARVRVPATDAP